MTESLTDRLEAHFRAHPDRWFDGMALSKIAGQYAWRSRCADLRKRGMVIENRQRRMTNAEGKRWTLSEYRYRPVEVSLSVNADGQTCFL